jgi:endonuclease G, mitochondrial
MNLRWLLVNIFLLSFLIHLLACGETEPSEPNGNSKSLQINPDQSPSDIAETKLERTLKRLGWSFAGISGHVEEVRHPFIVGRYNCTQRYPIVISHLIENPEGLGDGVERYKGNFITDDTLNNEKCVAPVHEDYDDSGYDRGHLAAANDFAGYGEVAMKQSFLTSNIAPQVGSGFNRDLWLNLEEATRYWLRTRSKLLIMTGVVANASPPVERIGVHELIVPTYFFKIIVDVSSSTGQPPAIAFLMKNIDHSDVDYGPVDDNLTNIQRHMVAIDTIEQMTGIDFFSNLPDDKEAAFEKVVWKMW